MDIQPLAFMASAEDFLFSISGMLYYPVVLGLVFLVIYILMLAGAVAREFLERKHDDFAAVAAYGEQLEAAMAKGLGTHPDLTIEALLQAAERDLIRDVEKARFIVRAAPGIGLMGTLIPMGIALAALSQGSMPEMADHMVKAFTSAVIGLGCGVAAFALALMREQWVRADLARMRYLSELALRDGELASLSAPHAVQTAEAA